MDKPADIPESAKNAVRTRFLKKKNKRKATRKVEKEQVTKAVTQPKVVKKPKKVK